MTIRLDDQQMHIILQSWMSAWLNGFAGHRWIDGIYFITLRHRISTARKEKDWGRHFFHQIEPNWPLPYTVPCQYHGWGMPGLLAGSPIAVYAEVQCPEPKTGQEKVQFNGEDNLLFLSFYYLSMGTKRSSPWLHSAWVREK